MDEFWNTILSRQYRAASDMFENALRRCPGELWQAELYDDAEMPVGFTAFWYIAYHALFWMDLYLAGAVEGFTPPPPFTLDELDPAGLLPPRVYSRQECLDYLAHNRQKALAVTSSLTTQQAQALCSFPWGELPFGELLVDNLRHVQEHGAQLSLFLGQKAGLQARWVAK